jgi:hypothetical protein
VIPWRELDRAVVPEGEAPLVPAQRGSEFVIRLDARALMGSQAHGSEEVLAEIVCGRIAHRPGARVRLLDATIMSAVAVTSNTTPVMSQPRTAGLLRRERCTFMVPIA